MTDTTTLLRLATAGSVDDGKSTLVGRLLYDTRSVLSDTLAAVERVSRERGQDTPDLALLTDGLRAEREQGITIDVAYRYFATPRRSFILADTPGHVQYTRNMVTGASTAEVAVVLVDARHGVVEQTRRHATVAALLGVPHLVLAVNKMDLVDFDEAVFTAIAAEFTGFARGLGVHDVMAIPVSASLGDNVVEPSGSTPWYPGPTLLAHLEQVPGRPDPGAEPFRLAVQWVTRPQSADLPDYRGFAGQVASGVVRVGDEVVVQPGGQRSTVTAIDGLDGPLDAAPAPLSVTLSLADEIDAARGALIADAARPASVGRELGGLVCWLDERPLRAPARLQLRIGSRTVRCSVSAIDSRLDVNSLGEEAADSLALNDIGRITVRTAEPVAFDAYRDNRATGAFLLLGDDGATLAAGMLDPLTVDPLTGEVGSGASAEGPGRDRPDGWSV